MAKLRKFIDIGANLTDLMYAGIYNGSKKHDNDLHQVLQRSWNAGLDKIIVTAGNVEESDRAIEISKLDDRLYATVGCHPTRCSEFEADADGYLRQLETRIEENRTKVAAIGECGLDYDRMQFCPKDVQKKYFELQLKLVERFDLPLFLHCRNAADDLFEILRDRSRLRGVVHSFDGTFEEAKRFVDLGFYIGINGCSLKTQENLDVAKQLPVDKLMIETDCPWCEIRPSHAGYKLISKDSFFAPTVKKEKWNADSMVKSRNEPANIRQVFDVLSAIRSEDADELEAQIYTNTVSLFF